MYVPAHFAMRDSEVRELLTHHGAADLVTATTSGLTATLLPFVYDPTVGEQGALLGHLARNNDQWRQQVIGEALVIVRGPDAYVSPSWYASKAEHGRVVPTWNYVTAHVYGRLVVHDDPDWVDALVRRLTDRHEAGNPRPWSVDDAPTSFVAGQLRAIVGVELVISRVDAKAKLSQNRPAADIDGVITGLGGRGDTTPLTPCRLLEPDRSGRLWGRRGPRQDWCPTPPAAASACRACLTRRQTSRPGWRHSRCMGVAARVPGSRRPSVALARWTESRNQGSPQLLEDTTFPNCGGSKGARSHRRQGRPRAPRLAATTVLGRPACQCCNTSTTSVTWNCLLAIRPPGPRVDTTSSGCLWDSPRGHRAGRELRDRRPGNYVTDVAAR